MVDNSTHVELAPINNITLIKKVLTFVCFVLTGEDPLPCHWRVRGIPAIDLADLGSLKNIKDQWNDHD